MATVVRVIHTEADGRTLSPIVVLPFSVVNLEKKWFYSLALAIDNTIFSLASTQNPSFVLISDQNELKIFIMENLWNSRVEISVKNFL